VESLFDRALDLAPEARNAFLDPECGGDEKLRQYMEQLLAVSAAAASNPGWGEPAILKVARASAEAADPNLDSYRLLQRIGVGAMGVVYRAVRSDDTFSKAQEPPDAAPDIGGTTRSAGSGGVTCACSLEEVAIRIVHRAAGDETTLRRRRTEHQMLANLEHRDIARLLDGGVAADGSPFLVMESSACGSGGLFPIAVW
jgi:serine/threonine-protein kinase